MGYPGNSIVGDGVVLGIGGSPYFDASVAGLGAHQLTLNYNVPNNFVNPARHCQGSISSTITVHPSSFSTNVTALGCNGSINTFNVELCLGGTLSGSYTVTGQLDLSGINGTFLPNALVDANGNFSLTFQGTSTCQSFQLQFNTSNAAGNQTYPFSITLDDPQGCLAQNPVTSTVTAVACPCACPAGANVFNVGQPGQITPASTAFGGQTSFNNACVSVQGNLFLNNNVLDFTNTRFYMNPGSSITLDNESKLSLNNCHLSGCSSMWKGILMKNKTKLLLLNNTLVEDAQYGVDIIALTVDLTVKNTTFNRNYTGIRASATNNNTIFISNGGFEGNTFDCTGPLLPYYAGQSPSPADRWAWTGLDFTNLLSYNILPQTGINTFRNLNNGIIASNSDLNISMTVFENIWPSNSQSYTTSGRAISCTGGSLNYTGINFLPGFGPASFQQCHTGIWTAQTLATNVAFAGMQAVNTGIMVREPLRDLVLWANNINARMYGVDLQNAKPRNSGTVRQNSIVVGTLAQATLPSPFRAPSSLGVVDQTGIRMNKCSYLEVYANQVQTTRQAMYGIFSQASSLNNLFLNQVNLDMLNKAQWGIHLGASDRNVLRENNVLGNTPNALPGSQRPAAYRLSYSLDNDIYCNNSGNVYYGFRFEAPSPSRFATNQTGINGTHFTGLSLSNTAVIDKQLHRGNLWQGIYNSGFGAINENVADMIASRFSIHTGMGTNFFPVLNSSNPNFPVNVGTAGGFLSDWFLNDPFGSPEICEHISQDEFGLIKGLGEKIAAGELGFGEYLPELNKQLDKELYDQIREQGIQFVPGSIMANFLDSIAALGVEHEFYLKRDAERGLLDLEASYAQSLAALDVLLLQYKATLAQLDSSLQLQYDVQQDSQTIQVAAALKQAREDIQLQLEAYQNAREAASINAKNLNTAINAQELADLFEQEVSEISLSTVAKGLYNFDSTQLATLQIIAPHCPLLGGRAVYEARSLLAIAGFSQAYNDDDACLQEGLLWRNAPAVADEMEPTAWQCYPNPAQDVFTLYRSGQLGTTVLTMHDMQGKLVLSQSLASDASTWQISTRHLPAGLYLLQCIDEQGIRFTEKLVIGRP